MILHILVDSLSIHFFILENKFRSIWRCTTISELMINEQIRDKEIRVIGENGEQLGIMSARDAMKLAKEAELDLVNICSNSKTAGLQNYRLWKISV